MAHSVSRNLHEDLTGEQRSIKTPKESRWWWIINTRKTATFCETKAIDRFYFILVLVLLIYLTYNILLVLPYIDMNPPRVYMCSPSWTPSHLPAHPIPLGHPSVPALSTLYHASNLDWQSISHMIIYMFQCHSPKPSHLRPLPQSPKDCFIHLCLFCCLAYRVIITIFLNSIYMR